MRFLFYCRSSKNFAVFEKKVLTNAPSSCNIIQVAARHRPGKKILLDWKRLARADDSDKKRKIKKFLTVRKRCGTINESLEAKPFKRKRTSKDKVVL